MNGYELLNREQLERRLALAEDVCRMFGWSPSHSAGTDREKAAYMLWTDWLAEAGSDAADPRRFPHLSDETVQRLAAARDEIRASTLRAIR